MWPFLVPSWSTIGSRTAHEDPQISVRPADTSPTRWAPLKSPIGTPAAPSLLGACVRRRFRPTGVALSSPSLESRVSGRSGWNEDEVYWIDFCASSGLHTFPHTNIEARKSVNLVVLIDIGAGTQRSTNIIANATYTFEGTACLSRSNQLAVSHSLTDLLLYTEHRCLTLSFSYQKIVEPLHHARGDVGYYFQWPACDLSAIRQVSLRFESRWEDLHACRTGDLWERFPRHKC